MRRGLLRLRPRGVLAAIAVVLFFAALFFSPTSPFQRGVREDFVQYTNLGEALLHGLDSSEGTVSSRMPLSTVTAALFFSHNNGWWVKCFEVLPLILVPLLILGIGGLIGSLEFALIGASLFHIKSFFDTDGFLWTYPQSYYSVYVLCVAFALVWRAQNPTPLRSAGLGVALGMSLMFRSSLAFFAPLLVACELLFIHRGSWRTGWKPLLPLLVVPYLFLIPVVRMNWILHGQWFAFEWGGPDNNIISAALGFVPTSDSALYSFLDDPPVLVGQGEVVRWALERILEHPFRYAYSCVLRVVYVTTLQPLLFGLAAVSLWLCRRKGEFLVLGLLVSYFVGIHCLMSVRAEYFVPLWPLLAVMGAAAPILGLGRLDLLRATPSIARTARIGGAAVLAAGLPLVLASWNATYAYGSLARWRPIDSREALEEGLRSWPEDAWLRKRLGQRMIREGRYPEAVREYGRALALSPDDADIALEHAWAHMLAGRYNPIFNFRPDNNDARIKVSLALYVAGKRQGNEEKARRYLNEAWRLWRGSHFTIHRVKTDLEKRTLKKLQDQDARAFIEEVIRRWGDLLPPNIRGALLTDFSEKKPKSPDLILDQAQYARNAGDRKTALEIIDRIKGLSLNREQSRRAAGIYSDIGSPHRALQISNELIRADAGEVGVWVDRAGYAAEKGDRLLSEESLARAEELGPSVREWRRVALLHQKWKNYSRAIEILGPLTKNKETAAAAFRDRGICEYLNGSADRAIDDLRLALRREPGMLSAALTLGVLYSSRDEFDREAEVYAKALRITPNKGERSLRPLIVENLKRVREREGS